MKDGVLMIIHIYAKVSKGIKVKTCLEETNLMPLNQILDFATSNNLVIKYIEEYNEKSD